MSYTYNNESSGRGIKLTAVDGPPGTGKTRLIVQSAKALGNVKAAVITYTKDAAAIVKQRNAGIVSGTIYALSWPYVKEQLQMTARGASYAASYTKRKIHHVFDPALAQYTADAPSAKPPHRLDAVARQLHGWAGGAPPFKLEAEKAEQQLKFVLPLARWLEAGAPMPKEEQFDLIMIDEAQDMSWVELRAALALVRNGGEAKAYGDPGQAVFGAAKGISGSSLPPVWCCADACSTLEKGYRVGDPVASVASGVLRSWYDRPASTFKAAHNTSLVVWDASIPPRVGLVLGYSRNSVAKAFKTWGLRATGVVPKVAKADTELVLSTGHAAKGAEANHVYLLPWSRQALERFQGQDPATLRLLYVMLTRARGCVHVPRTLKARLL
tara:strand:+ start:437 stop:1585 length:1149 start_codon:yes stop_codon:yes gene_type:complete